MSAEQKENSLLYYDNKENFVFIDKQGNVFNPISTIDALIIKSVERHVKTLADSENESNTRNVQRAIEIMTYMVSKPNPYAGISGWLDPFVNCLYEKDGDVFASSLLAAKTFMLEKKEIQDSTDPKSILLWIWMNAVKEFLLITKEVKVDKENVVFITHEEAASIISNRDCSLSI